MFELTEISAQSKTDFYKSLAKQLHRLLEGERDFLANCANSAALIFRALPDVNWAGFYFYKGGNLILGPFQGKPACSRIAIGKGVCGTAAEKMKTIVVKNVHDFAGHIACDGASNSEIVVPMIKQGKLLGVLDVDSPQLARFDEEDKAGLEVLVELILSSSDV
ncbi:MAG: GAF domain-containing protein [Chloroherpetonaceae bacterium]|nr:GAF domain-containing protein [Chloroherpetonaceae bacterium]MDW8436972.1 GAF domain-containing protein [Chloroherpetonaceae bacterium]